ncbi:hypothetical protein NDN08_007540 [Rhodosorus marinus]|uniref:Uncharacterized protein n=1 Tax=Rhodosorus marinus TaxID=101924 RepID=A0AAV8UXU7_9RHOD|nr:hypothetical protein NDN08_007540 [Rhodosorus marinus]
MPVRQRSETFTGYFDGETELMLVKRLAAKGDKNLCQYLFDSVFYCLSIRHQARTYYHEGGLDGCRELNEAMKKCWGMKFPGKSIDEVMEGNDDASIELPWKFKEEYLEAVKKKDIADRYNLGDHEQASPSDEGLQENANG